MYKIYKYTLNMLFLYFFVFDRAAFLNASVDNLHLTFLLSVCRKSWKEYIDRNIYNIELPQQGIQS